MKHTLHIPQLSLRTYLSAFLLMCIPLLITFAAWSRMRSDVEHRKEITFAIRTQHAESLLHKTVREHVHVLFGARDVLSQYENVEEDTWFNFVKSRESQSHTPGISLLAYVQHEGRQKKKDLYAIRFMNPMDELFRRRIVMEPTGREAIADARDSGALTMITPVGLVEDKKALPLLLLPVYDSEKKTKTSEQRQKAFRGVIVATLSMDEIIESAFADDARLLDILFTITTNDTDANSVQIFHGNAWKNANSDIAVSQHRQSKIAIGEESWDIEYAAKEESSFEDIDTIYPTFVLGVGVAFSLLLFGIALSVIHKRTMTMKQTRKLSKQLLRTDQELRIFKVAIEASASAIGILQADGTIVYGNPAFVKVCKCTLKELGKKSITDIFKQKKVSKANQDKIQKALKAGKEFTSKNISVLPVSDAKAEHRLFVVLLG